MRRRYRWPWRTLALGAVLFLLSFGTMAEDPGTLVKEALAKLRAPEARGRRLGAERLAAAVQTAELAGALEGRTAGSGLPGPEECRAALEAVRAAAPELVRLALADPDPDVRGPLQSIFPVFGEAARPLLEQLMQSSDAAARREAFSFWLRGAKDPTQTWPKVQAAAGDPDPGMRALANWGEDYREQFERIYPELARAHGVALYPFFLEGVAMAAYAGLWAVPVHHVLLKCSAMIGLHTSRYSHFGMAGVGDDHV